MNPALVSASILALGFVFLTGTAAVMALGAPKEVDLGGGCQNSLQYEDLGRFAVAEHNKKANSLLAFDKVVKAKEQVVAGTLYHLTIEVTEGEQKNLYEAKIWEKPWLNFKELQEFKRIDSSSQDH